MEFLLAFALEILPLDALVASIAYAAVELVVVSLAVWGVVDYVECRSLERFETGFADEAVLVITSCEASVGRGDRFAFDSFTTALAVSFRSGRAAGSAGWGFIP